MYNGEEVQEEVNMAHKDAIRNCLAQINNQMPQKTADDPEAAEEMVAVWFDFVSKN